MFHTCCEFYMFVFDKDNIPSKAVPGTFLNLDMYSGRVAGQAEFTHQRAARLSGLVFPQTFSWSGQLRESEKEGMNFWKRQFSIF